MGIVYQAKDPRDGRPLAIKVLRPEAAEDRQELNRFKREFRLLARLRHPNIVRVFDAGIEDDVPFITMEYLEGMNLRKYMTEFSSKTVREKEIRRVMAEIYQALSYTHRRNIVHRDLKPENVFVTKENRVKLMDFGVAHFHRTAEGESELFGTFAYMAPEQILSRPVDSRADLYATGIMMYEFLADSFPFPVEPPAAALHNHVNMSPKPLRQVAPHVDRKLAALVDRLLQKDPDKRPASANAAFEALEGKKLIVKTLDAELHRFAVRLALLGRNFTKELVLAAFELKAAKVESSLQKLVSLGILRADSPQNWAFRDESARKRFLERVSKPERKRASLALAIRVESSSLRGQRRMYGPLAGLYKRSAQPERSLKFFRRLIQEQLRLGYLTKAKRNLKSVYAVLNKLDATPRHLERRFACQLLDIDLSIASGDFKNALSLIQTVEMSDTGQTEVGRYRLGLRQIRMATARGNLLDADRLLDQFSQRAPTRSIGAQLLVASAHVRFMKGEYPQSLALYKAAFDLLDQDTSLQKQLQLFMADVLLEQERVKPAALLLEDVRSNLGDGWRDNMGAVRSTRPFDVPGK